MKRLLNLGLSQARRLVVAIIGGTLLLIGIVAGPLPFVPAAILVPAGLAVLATEFVWARRLLRAIRDRVGHRTVARQTRGEPEQPVGTGSPASSPARD